MSASGYLLDNITIFGMCIRFVRELALISGEGAVSHIKIMQHLYPRIEKATREYTYGRQCELYANVRGAYLVHYQMRKDLEKIKTGLQFIESSTLIMGPLDELLNSVNQFLTKCPTLHYLESFSQPSLSEQPSTSTDTKEEASKNSPKPSPELTTFEQLVTSLSTETEKLRTSLQTSSGENPL